MKTPTTKPYTLLLTLCLASPFTLANQVQDITGSTATLRTMDIGTAIGNDKYNEALIKIKQSQNTEIAMQMAKKVEAGEASKEELIQSMEKMVFPVQTNSMSLNASAQTERKPTKATQPIAVIGSDTYSINWLNTNINELQRLGAMIVVVEVRDLESFNKVRAGIPSNIKIIPANGYPLTQTFGVTEYPALITSKGIYH
ncbi:PFL_4695 family integrating conjugative element protein [Vibrio gangliei]|uniref:PFL_4695 family integrating conjugative element protein n=1 Tax=Vibrio gangliei TaxID=2077090 RepID=UPI000D01CF9B|nr:integrating conjugative element protein [Vibrio gangliei]